MTLGSVNSILDTIYNKDISGPEKALQIVTQLGIMLPMIISGLSALNKITIAGEAATWGTVLAKAQEIALTITQNGLTGVTIVLQKALNKVVLANPFVMFAMAIMGVITALSLFNKSNEEAKEKPKKITKQALN